MAAAAERVGAELHVLVNNAGIAVSGPVEVVPVEDWRRQMEINLLGQVAVTRALLPAVLRARGHIVNMSSIGGRVANPLFGPYSASKFALEAMSDALRREVAPHGVRVVVVEPGGIATPIWEKGHADADRMLEGADAGRRPPVRRADRRRAALDPAPSGGGAAARGGRRRGGEGGDRRSARGRATWSGGRRRSRRSWPGCCRTARSTPWWRAT